MTGLRPCWVEVDLDALRGNLEAIRRHLAPGVEVMAVVKADGYGHGARQVAEVALEAGARFLAVAILDEALELRASGITAPILVLGYIPPWQAEAVVRHQVTVTVYEEGMVRALDRAARRAGRRAPVHLKVDTGMGRLGVRGSAELRRLAAAIRACPGVVLEGVFTHFAAADEPDKAYTLEQVDRFRSALDNLKREGLEPVYRHAANSAGILDVPSSYFNLVRPGLILYGLYPSRHVRRLEGVRPALTWKARLAHVKVVEAGAFISYGRTYRASRSELIGTVPVGYADGYSRLLSNRGRVLLRGRSFPVVGRVCMDQLMVRLEGLEPPPEPGEEVVLLGESGEARFTADDMAECVGTINYEVVCAIARRVPRLYLRKGVPVEVRTLLGTRR